MSAEISRPDDTARQSINRHVLAGSVAVVLLLGGVGGWAATTELSGAVIASGTVVVDTNIKKVQHLSGGIVDDIFVKDGARVRAGDVLLRLDETLTRANLSILVKSQDELLSRQARLEAERDSDENVRFPAELLERRAETGVERILHGEQRLFELRQVARSGQKGQLQERISQLREEILGLTGQANAKRREIELINSELEAVRDLWKKNLVPISRLTALERETVRLDGERNQLIASAAQTKGKTTETELQIIQIDQDLRSEVARELREIQAKLAETIERRVAAEDQMKRIDIRAPQDGIIYQLSIHTKGAVISPGELLMYVVPESDELIIEAKVLPRDIDQISVGQKAKVRLGAFNQRTTPEIVGIVTRASADAAQDQKTGFTYYLIRVGLSASEIAKLGDLKLIPGMPVEAFIQTDDRTVISYLVKPLQEQIVRAFRER